MTDTREQTVETLLRLRVSAIVRTSDQALARDAMKAAVAGGFRALEFTLTTPGALQLVAEFSRDSDVVVGAGTVLSAEAVAAAQDAGARFVVSPVCDPEVIAAARERGLASIPGTFTPTEMWTAHRAGADFVKLFPAHADVVETLIAVRAPLPQLRIFPTAGITMENFPRVLAAGAAGVGFVRPLFRPEDMERRDFAAIEERAARILGTLAKLPR